MKKILITGENSYIGNQFQKWVIKNNKDYEIDKISLRDRAWTDLDFSKYNVILHLSAIVHQNEKNNTFELYENINTKLTMDIATKAKNSNVSQFIFMSTMAVYGEEGKIGQKVVMDKETSPNPKTMYGKTKLMAEEQLQKITDTNFKVVILRPPMVYGENCVGNYARLEKLAKISPIFPLVDNERSMVSTDKLSELISQYIDIEAEGLFLPQNDDYVNTSALVKKLGESYNKKIYLSKSLGLFIIIFCKKIGMFKKIFGNLVYKK